MGRMPPYQIGLAAARGRACSTVPRMSHLTRNRVSESDVQTQSQGTPEAAQRRRCSPMYPSRHGILMLNAILVLGAAVTAEMLKSDKQWRTPVLCKR